MYGNLFNLQTTELPIEDVLDKEHFQENAHDTVLWEPMAE